MKILFVYPNVTRAVSPQIGICMIAAVAIKLGHVCDIYDLTTVPKGEELSSFKGKVFDFKPDVLAVSCRSNEWPCVKELLEGIDTSGIFTIAGGSHATVAPEQVLGLVDIAVIGEGEETFAEILNLLSGGEDCGNVTGSWSKSNGKIIRNEMRDLICDLDTLPLPYWRIFDDIHYYKSYILEIIREAKVVGTFEGSRGCPFACTYCTNDYVRGLYKGRGKWRREKSPERIIREMKSFRSDYGLDCVYWIDEVLLTGIERLERLKNLYLSQIDLPFFFMERPENMTQEKVKIIKETGACSVSIGIESGDEKIRRQLLNRRHSQEKIVSAFKNARKYGIKAHAFTMIGFPFEDRDSIYRSYGLIRRARPDTIQTTIFYPLKKTKLWQTVVDEKLFDPQENMGLNYYDKTYLNFPESKKKDILRYQLLLSHYRSTFIRFLVEARLPPALIRLIIAIPKAPGILVNKVKRDGITAAAKAIMKKVSLKSG